MEKDQRTCEEVGPKPRERPHRSIFSSGKFGRTSIFSGHYFDNAGFGEGHGEPPSKSHLALSDWIVKEIGIVGCVNINFSFKDSVPFLDVT